MSSEQKKSTKPKVYQLTDKWFIYIIGVALVFPSIFYLFSDSVISALSQFGTSLIFGLFSYFGMKFIHLGHAKMNPSITKKALKIFIGFFWGIGVFMGFIYPFILLITETDKQLIVEIIANVSIAGPSFSLGASHSWKYLSVIEERQKAKN